MQQAAMAKQRVRQANESDKPKQPCTYIELEGDFLGFHVRNGKLYAHPGNLGPMDVEVLISNYNPGQHRVFRATIGTIISHNLLPQLDQETKGQRFTYSFLKLFIKKNA